MDFWRKVFSDNDQPSFSRIGTAMALCFACGWITAIVAKTHQLPDATGIAALAGFVGVLYGINTVPKIKKDDH